MVAKRHHGSRLLQQVNQRKVIHAVCHQQGMIGIGVVMVEIVGQGIRAKNGSVLTGNPHIGDEAICHRLRRHGLRAV